LHGLSLYNFVRTGLYTAAHVGYCMVQYGVRKFRDPRIPDAEQSFTAPLSVVSIMPETIVKAMQVCIAFSLE
jgi:hypothetical protein